MSHPSPVLWPHPTSHPASSWISLHQLIPFVTVVVGYRPDETSPVPSPATDALCPPRHPALPTPESSSRLLFRFFAASIAFAMRDRLGSLLFPSWGLTCRCCKFHFMLQAAALLPFLRELQRFDIASHPATSVACYVASCQLPRPDLHRLADDVFQDTPRCVRQHLARSRLPCFFASLCLNCREEHRCWSGWSACSGFRVSRLVDQHYSVTCLVLLHLLERRVHLRHGHKFNHGCNSVLLREREHCPHR